MAATATLPGGLWQNGERHRDAEVRPLTGEDELLLAEILRDLTPARGASALFERCVERVGPVAPVTADVARTLTVGDREALLLHARRATLGDRMQAVVHCASESCKAPMDLNLRVSTLLVPPYPDARERYEVRVEGDGEAWRVRFRVPTGGDQEAAAALAAADLDASVNLLFERCVEEVVAEGSGTPVEALPPAVARAMPAEMLGRDEQAEIILNLECPECGEPFSALFDAGAYVLAELVAAARDVYQEVHFLAYHYHWSATEILAMTPRRRRIFLTLLQNALDEEVLP